MGVHHDPLFQRISLYSRVLIVLSSSFSMLYCLYMLLNFLILTLYFEWCLHPISNHWHQCKNQSDIQNIDRLGWCHGLCQFSFSQRSTGVLVNSGTYFLRFKLMWPHSSITSMKVPIFCLFSPQSDQGLFSTVLQLWKLIFHAISQSIIWNVTFLGKITFFDDSQPFNDQ